MRTNANGDDEVRASKRRLFLLAFHNVSSLRQNALWPSERRRNSPTAIKRIFRLSVCLSDRPPPYLLVTVDDHRARASQG